MESTRRRHARWRLVALLAVLAFASTACGRAVSVDNDPGYSGDTRYATEPGKPLVFTTERLLENDAAWDRGGTHRGDKPTVFELMSITAPSFEGEHLCFGFVGLGGCPHGDGLCPTSDCATTEGGTVKMQADNTILYTPRKGFAGMDAFKYRGCEVYWKSAPADDVVFSKVINCDEATVTVAADATVVTTDDTISAVQGVAEVSADSLLRNDAFHVYGADRPVLPGFLTFDQTSTGGGTVTFDKVTMMVTYTAPSNNTGAAADTFAYRVCHSSSSTDTLRPCARGIVNVRFPRTTTTLPTPSFGGGGFGDFGGGATDTDGDGVPDSTDNCPTDANTSQTDTDADTIGDACDPTPGGGATDTDGDGVPDSTDNCPTDANTSQADTDADTIGDACDPTPGGGGGGGPVDTDGDTVPDAFDNCPAVPNLFQTDTDFDTFGDACDAAPADPLVH